MKAFNAESIGVFAALAPLAAASIGTTTLTSLSTVTDITTSTSTIPGCSVTTASPQINCVDGYYDTYGAKWQEVCSATVSGGSLRLVGAALSLRACMSACAVNAGCSGVYWQRPTLNCFYLTGDFTITPGGPFEAAYRYSADYEPCETTVVSTVVDVVTVTSLSTYSITPTSTPTPTPTPVVSDTSSSPSASNPPIVSPSSPVSSPPSSSRPVIPSGTNTPNPQSPPASSHILTPRPSPPPSNGGTTTGANTQTGSDSTFTSISDNTSSTGTGSEATETPITDPEDPEDCEEDDEPTTTEGVTTSQTPPPPLLSSTTTVPMTTSTVTVTDVHTITACPPSVRNCPASDKTTYYITKTLSIYTTICPVSATETAWPDSPATTQAPYPSEPTDEDVDTVYETLHAAITACPSWVTECPAAQQTGPSSPEAVPSEPGITYTVIPMDVPTATGGAAGGDESGPNVTGVAAGEQPATFTTAVVLNSLPASHIPSVSASSIPSSSQEQPPSGTSSTEEIVFTGAASGVQSGFLGVTASLVCVGVAAVVLL
ncbi:hypothetical protein BJX64DRAFT_252314 [Aspergillus heterothallicus]